MDLLLGCSISYDRLASFLDKEFGQISYFLVYPEVSDWEDVSKGAAVVQYHSAAPGPPDAMQFQAGLSLFADAADTPVQLEILADRITNVFGCGVLCDANRVLLTSRSNYYSLLFENGRVFLVDDRLLEDEGTVEKVVELNYVRP